MKTTKTIMEQLTNTERIVNDLKQTLKETDPNYPQEEQQYLRAAEALRQTAAGADDVIRAYEQELVSNMIYAGWLGFQLKYDCFLNPVNKQLLNEDFEELLREERMQTLPMTRNALDTLETFHTAASQEQRMIAQEVSSFFCYLQTAGYKLAHHFGFSLADDFLLWVVPGYVKDPISTGKYDKQIRSFLRTQAPGNGPSPLYPR